MRSISLVVALALFASLQESAVAQSPGRPNTREGFWIGFGVGGGSTETKCDSSCTDSRSEGGSVYLRMGGTVSSKVLLGGEVNGWAVSEGGKDKALGFASFIVMWYPSATGGFYLKGGLGGMTYKETDAASNELTATAPSVSLGLGYEIRVSRNMSVVPFFNGLATSAVRVRFNGSPVPTGEDIKVSMAQLGVGLTWH